MIHYALLSFFWHPLGYCVGTHSAVTACRSYNWWSGIGSDIGEVTLVGIFLGAWRHVNCHAPWCFRLGRHPVDGTPFKVCRKHHPGIPDKLTLEHIHLAHRHAHNHKLSSRRADVIRLARTHPGVEAEKLAGKILGDEP